MKEATFQATTHLTVVSHCEVVALRLLLLAELLVALAEQVAHQPFIGRQGDCDTRDREVTTEHLTAAGYLPGTPVY